VAATDCLAIIGVGLIGGSIGLAARRSGKYRPILGVDRDLQALQQAKVRGCIDEISDELATVAKLADIIVVCTPVDQIAAHVLTAARHCRAKTLITDSGSTKVNIVEAVERGLARKRLFIGSHPLCGSEKRGPEFARETLFDGRLVILTATELTPALAIHRATTFWESLGGRIWGMTAEDHDRTLALTSHLPHLVGSALAGLLHPGLAGFAATGFRDTTRLAAGDPNLWAAIFAENAPHVLASVKLFQDRLEDFRKAIQTNDVPVLHRLLTEAKGIRDDLGN